MVPGAEQAVVNVTADQFWVIICPCAVALQTIFWSIFNARSKGSSDIEKFTHRLSTGGLHASGLLTAVAVTGTFRWIAIPVPPPITQSAGWPVVFWTICVGYLAFKPLLDKFRLHFEKLVSP